MKYEVYEWSGEVRVSDRIKFVKSYKDLGDFFSREMEDVTTYLEASQRIKETSDRVEAIDMIEWSIKEGADGVFVWTYREVFAAETDTVISPDRATVLGDLFLGPDLLESWPKIEVVRVYDFRLTAGDLPADDLDLYTDVMSGDDRKAKIEVTDETEMAAAMATPISIMYGIHNFGVFDYAEKIRIEHGKEIYEDSNLDQVVLDGMRKPWAELRTRINEALQYVREH